MKKINKIDKPLSEAINRKERTHKFPISEIKMWTSKFQINHLTLHLNEQEKEQTKWKGRWRKVITKISSEIKYTQNNTKDEWN